MKQVNMYLKIFFLLITVFFCSKINAQVSGFSISTPAAVNNLGVPFQVSVSYSVSPTTLSDTVRVTYNPLLVSYDASQTFVPSCMSVSNSGSVLTITAGDLSSCDNISSIVISAGFRFLCPDSCTGVTKSALFTGTIKDNLGTVIAPSTCTATGILTNSVTMQHVFSAYNAVSNQVTYRITYNDPNCFKIKTPKFNVTLTPAIGSIISASGTNNTYTVTGNTITPVSGVINGPAADNIYYVVQLPCNAAPGTTLNSSVTFTGTNCNVANSTIAPAANAAFTLPTTPPVANSSVSVTTQAGAGYFLYTISNTGNTTLNLTANSFLPAVHLTTVYQQTDQTGTNSLRYFDCALAQTVFPIAGPGFVADNNAPANTRRLEHTINNLQPGKFVYLYKYYNTASSCNGAAGTPPFKDSVSIAYNCVTPPNPCIPCGPGGTWTGVSIYNPAPVIQCTSSFSMPNCRDVRDTITVTYSFRNTGDAPLPAGHIFNAPLPTWLTAIPGSVVFTNFPSAPTVVPASNIQFSLPALPVNTTTYTVSFNAVIQPGAISGTTAFYTRVTGANYNNNFVCYTQIKICSLSAIDITKEVKGSQNAGFATTGTGAPNTDVEYRITLFNSGTTVINNLEVIDRIPAPGTLTINGNPTNSTPVTPNQFSMQMLQVPASADYTTAYNAVQNACTGWPSTGTNCNAPGPWVSTVANGAVKFTFNSGFTIQPGSSHSFTFKMHIPTGISNGLTDCNTAGFLAAAVNGPALYATESNQACVGVFNPCNTNVTPAFTFSASCVNNVYTVNTTSLEPSTTSHQWSLMQINCGGGTSDANTIGMVGPVQTTTNASFAVPTGSNCYYIKHRIFIAGCYDTTIRTLINVPLATNAFQLQDINGTVKTTFCFGEDVIFNGSASTGETQYVVEVRRRLIGSPTFTNYVTLGTYFGQAGTLNLSQLLLLQNLYFEPTYQYAIYFTISNPGNCIGPITNKAAFNIECCDEFFNAGFQLSVTPAAGSYTIASVLFNPYTTANALHEWYVLSSPNPSGGPYTPVYSTTAASLTYSAAQYNLYYTVIHKVITVCGEVCSSRTQYQTDNKNMSEETDACCLALLYWANGAGNPPVSMSAAFELDITSSGVGQFTISATATNPYSNVPGVIHEWYVWSSPNPTGGPYTPVSQGTGLTFSYTSATDGQYYFVIHKVKTPCGEVCASQDVCRNCGEQKACDVKWPDCYPPINLKNDCRRHTLSWDPVTAAGGYELELYYNDPACCRSEYEQVVKVYSLDGTRFDLDEIDHPKYNCIRWRVRAKCKEGYSEWSSWSCYYCGRIIGDPEFPIAGKGAAETKAKKEAAAFNPQIFPNPNSGDMFLRMKTKGELTVAVNVFNSMGVLVKTMAESKYPDGNFVSNLNLGSHAAKGLYLVVFKTNFGTYTEKVIIQ